MLPDRVSNPGPLTYESGALPIALCGPANLRDDSSPEIKNHLCEFLSIKEDLVKKILSKRIIQKRALTSAKTDTIPKKLKRGIPEPNISQNHLL